MAVNEDDRRADEDRRAAFFRELDANGQMVIDTPTDEETAEEQEVYRKAARLDGTYTWMLERYRKAVRLKGGNYDSLLPYSYAGSLFFIETGHAPVDRPGDFEEFRFRLAGLCAALGPDRGAGPNPMERCQLPEGHGGSHGDGNDYTWARHANEGEER